MSDQPASYTLPTPPLVAAEAAPAPKFQAMPDEDRARIKQAALNYLPCMHGKLPEQMVMEYVRAQTDFQREVTPETALATLGYIEQLEAENATLRSRLKEEEEATTEKLRAQHKVEVLDILRDMRLPLIAASEGERLGEYAQGINKERQAQNDYARQKAYEYSPEGIGPDPTKAGEWDTLPKAAAAPPLQGEGEPKHDYGSYVDQDLVKMVDKKARQLLQGEGERGKEANNG